jgi:hypothetical protein
MSESKNEEWLRKLLKKLQGRIDTYGPRSKEVKKFVHKHKDVDEFVELSATAIFAFENSPNFLKKMKRIKKVRQVSF